MKKSKTALLAALGLVTLGLALGFTLARWNASPAVFVPPLTVIGDVERVVSVASLGEAGAVQKIRSGSGFFRGVPLQELLTKAGPQDADKICLVAGDGFTAVLKADSLEASYLVFSAENGWEVVNLHHPPSSNAKMVQEIIVVSGESPALSSLTLVDGTAGGAEALHTTVGELYTRDLLSYPYFEGRATLEHEGRSYTAEVYTRRRVFKLEDLVPGAENTRAILLGEDGGCLLADNDGFFELTGNRIAYLQPETRERLTAVRLVVADPPAATIMDVYYDARHYLEKGDDVLLLLLEGFDCSQYAAALAADILPFLQEKEAFSPALGLYPFESGLWLEAMFTGFVPAQNNGEAGVGPGAENLFTLCKSLGKPAAVLNAGGEIFADLDEQFVVQGGRAEGCRDEGGDADALNDAIYNDLLCRLSEDQGLLVAVFHTSTEGPTAAKATSPAGWEPSPGTEASWDTVEKVDGHLRKLASLWPGKIIITALPAAGGKAGSAPCSENLFVPYLLLGEAGS